jgi:hypothetical protein
MASSARLRKPLLPCGNVNRSLELKAIVQICTITVEMVLLCTFLADATLACRAARRPYSPLDRHVS